MSELKPCIRCGGHMSWNDNEFESAYVCDDCHYFVEWDGMPEEFVKWWNTRPIEDALRARIAELEALVEGHDPFEEFPPKERGFECSVMVLGKFEYEEEFTPFTNWDLCVYWFDEERWHPLNGYVKGDDIVRWYALPHEEREE